MTRALVAVALIVLAMLGIPLAAALTLTAATASSVVITSPRQDPDTGSNRSPEALANPVSEAASGAAVRRVLWWADARVGDRYVMGANGPDSWDCSSFTQAAWAQVGVKLPRIAQDQRDWLASGHGTRIAPDRERPGDLIFWDSYLGPRTIGHVVIVRDPSRNATVEAHNTARGVGHFTYHPDHHRYEIWRPHLESRP